MNDQGSTSLHDPARWLAVLRIAFGLWFIKALWSKWVLLGGVLPIPVASERWVESLTRIVSGYLEGHPLPWYRDFLENTVLANAELFANLTAIGEVAIGIGLVFGFMTGVASMIGLLVTSAYVLGGLGLILPRQGLRLLVWITMLAFLFARAGRVWGLDGWIARKYPDSFLARFPLS